MTAHADVATEAKLIGATISSELYRDQVFASVTADCFYDVGNRRMFEWLLGRYMLGVLPADQRDVFTEAMRDDVIDRPDIVRYFYEGFGVGNLIESLTSLRDARSLQAAAGRALETLSVNPLASATIIQDLKRQVDEIDPAAGLGEHLYTWGELSEEEYPQDWIIPDLLDRDHVMMVTGPNGGGKSTLCLQLSVCAAIGIHPWTAQPIPRQRVLCIDAENSVGVIARKKRIANKMVDLGGDPDVENIRFRFGGVNLADPADRLRLEHHMQSFRPDMVMLGPIYKMYSTGSDDSWRSEAQAVQTWVDQMRRKYRFATLIEGHPPKGDGSGAPKGDSSWSSWPYFGFCITLDDQTRSLAEVTPWRYPREPVRMPESIRWGSPDSHEPTRRLMWSPIGPLKSSEDW